MQAEVAILRAMYRRVASASTDLPLEWVGRSFDVPENRRYVRVALLPAGTERVLIGSRAPQRLSGILQLTVMWGLENGEQPPMEVAGQLAELFPTDLRLVEGEYTIRIVRRPEIAAPVVEPSGMGVPVSVRYESWVSS